MSEQKLITENWRKFLKENEEQVLSEEELKRDKNWKSTRYRWFDGSV